MNELFLQVISLDQAINEAVERGDEQEETRLYDQQNAIVDKIESMGLRPAFDEFIESIS